MGTTIQIEKAKVVAARSKDGGGKEEVTGIKADSVTGLESGDALV